MSAETQAVRPGEQLDASRLEPYLRERLGLQGEMELRQFAGGHSNLTYLVCFGESELVLRRPPLGPVAPTAHDMAREYRWLAALHPVFPKAPRPLLLCEDVGVLGTVFYVMERRNGRVVRHEDVAAWATRPEDCRRVSLALVDTLAELHGLELSANGLAHLGKPAGFVMRQVRGWSERWQRSKLDALPEMEQLSTWLVERLPPDPQAPAVVHGDFKLDNVMLDAADAGSIVAVLDWEMCALGDPLVDLGILLAYWPPSAPGHLPPASDGSGWPSRDEIVTRYAEKSGRDVARVRYYETFALFKVAVVIQQIYYRYARGQTDDPRFKEFGPRVGALAREAALRAQEADA